MKEENDLGRNREGQCGFRKHMPRFVMLNTENIEKEKLGVAIKSPFTKEEVQQLEIAFVDDKDFTTDGERVVKK